MRRGSTTERGRSSRDGILDAAVAEFTSKGYRGSSLNGIATRADITKSGLLHHFESKELLLAAVLEERTAKDRTPSAGTVSSDDPILEQYSRTVEHNQRELSWVKFFTIMVAESFTSAPQALPILQRRYAKMHERTASNLRHDYPDADESTVHDVVAILVAAMDGLQILRLMSDDFDMTVPFAALIEMVDQRLLARSRGAGAR